MKNDTAPRLDFSLIGRVMHEADSMRRQSPMARIGTNDADGWPIESYERVPVVVVTPEQDSLNGWRVRGAREYRVSIAGYSRIVSRYVVHGLGEAVSA
jgi:hypothetical protein